MLSFFKGISEPISVAFIALTGVLVSAIISALIAFVTSRKAIYINAVTVERSKWIEKLRDNIAKYSGLAHAVFYKAKNEDFEKGLSVEYYSLLRQLQDLRSLLKLQLNPRGYIDQNIIELIDHMYELSRRWTVGPELVAKEKLLVLHAQWLLKAEWEKVKSEARGFLRRLISVYFEWKARREYRDFVAGDGQIAPLSPLTGGQPSS